MAAGDAVTGIALGDTAMTYRQQRASTRGRSAASVIVLIGALSGTVLALQVIGRVSSVPEAAATIACGVVAAVLIGVLRRRLDALTGRPRSSRASQRFAGVILACFLVSSTARDLPMTTGVAVLGLLAVLLLDRMSASRVAQGHPGSSIGG